MELKNWDDLVAERLTPEEIAEINQQADQEIDPATVFGGKK